MRRWVAVAVAALTLMGCSPKAAPTSSADPDALVVWTDAAHHDAIAAAAATFTHDTGVKVSIVTQSLAASRELMLARIPYDKGPDVSIGLGEWTGYLVDQQVVAPVNLGAQAAGFDPVALRNVTANGTGYGVPVDRSTVFLLRNTALAPDVPATFDDLVQSGRDLTDKGKVDVPVAIGDGRPGQADAYHLYPLQTSFSAPLLATTGDGSYDNHAVGMNTDGGAAFATYLAGLGSAKALDPQLTADAATQKFAAGRLAYYVTDASVLPAVRQAEVRYAISAVPRAGTAAAQGFVGSTVFFQSARSKHATEAQRFLTTVVASAPVQAQLAKATDLPPALRSVGDPTPSDDATAIGAVADGGVAMPNGAGVDNAWNAWSGTESALLTGAQTDPPAAWRDMCTAVADKIKK